ncbi:MAG TPA: nucleotide pyrophosphohydrolase [Gemmatales bacterium]|nr:nucleotide pyrophosphohydrolase [Gemmatales bacterium]HMP60343.1 nucleotide pyrophosphohydrolase [Gemmatales bacterium]
MTDATTTLADLRAAVGAFVSERAWEKYHTPKNLAMSIAIEAAELMEHFQWLRPEEAQAVGQDAEQRSALGAELADVTSYVLALCNVLDLDLSAAVESKLAQNRIRYPVERCYGEYRREMKSGEGG